MGHDRPSVPAGMPILADYRRPGHHLRPCGVLAARVAQALRFGHAQCGSDNGVDDQVSARLRGEPAAAEPGPAGPGLPGPGRARRGPGGAAERRAAHPRSGARRLRLGPGARRHLGGQPALPRVHPGRADQGLAAVRHAHLVRVDPGHLLAGGGGRDPRREHGAAADRRPGRDAGDGGRLLRLRGFGREPVRPRRRARGGQAEGGACARPGAAGGWRSARTRTPRSSTRCGSARWTR